MARRILAIHEASHAVVALELGYEVVELWIGEDGGGCVVEPEPCAAVLLAGFVGNMLDTGICPSWDALDGGDPRSDVWRARATGEDFGAARALAEGILRERWARWQHKPRQLDRVLHARTRVTTQKGARIDGHLDVSRC
jgi:hypothetical protein